MARASVRHEFVGRHFADSLVGGIDHGPQPGTVEGRDVDAHDRRPLTEKRPHVEPDLPEADNDAVGQGEQFGELREVGPGHRGVDRLKRPVEVARRAGDAAQHRATDTGVGRHDRHD